MKIFGFEITKTKKAPPVPVGYGRGWWPVIREAATGNWQRNITVDRETILAHFAVFACQTLIASDIAKLRIKLVEEVDGIWSELKTNSPFHRVLRKPNKSQNRIQFMESWVLSKLIRGNTYVLKGRDDRGLVNRLWVLDPDRVQVLVTEDGDIYYRLSADNVPGIMTDVTVPASEIIHDRFNCIFHPLVGIPPLWANSLSATQGLNIQNQSSAIYANHGQPGGILTAVGEIDSEAIEEIKKSWKETFGGSNAGGVAVLGEGLTYQKLAITAVEGQVIDQLKWTAEVICATYHVPPYKIGVGTMPAYNNIQALNIEYYQQCLQILIEAIELCLDEGLGLDEKKEGRVLGTEFDTENLMRMDSKTQMEVLKNGAGVMQIDEMRARINLPKTDGGDDVYLQQQNYSLRALRERDLGPDPFGNGKSGQETANDNSKADGDTQLDQAAGSQRHMARLYRRARLSARLGLTAVPIKEDQLKLLPGPGMTD